MDYVDDLEERRAVRAAHAQVERGRLVKHQEISAVLLAATPADCERYIAAARQVVARWRSSRVCSIDYIEMWTEILDAPVEEMTEVMCSHVGGWGRALRQNTPWFWPLQRAD